MDQKGTGVKMRAISNFARKEPYNYVDFFQSISCRLSSEIRCRQGS